MTSINYSEIFEYFLGYVTDYDFANLQISDVYELMTEWLNKTLSHPYVRQIFSTISKDNTIQTLSYEMAHSVDDESDKDFVLVILAKGMVIEWLSPIVKSKLNINQFFGGKEQKFFSQSNHLEQLRGLLEDTQLEQRKMIRDRGYIYNDYLVTE